MLYYKFYSYCIQIYIKLQKNYKEIMKLKKNLPDGEVLHVHRIRLLVKIQEIFCKVKP